jgi:hypothetical protein
MLFLCQFIYTYPIQTGAQLTKEQSMNKLLTSAAALAAFLSLFWSSQMAPITTANNGTIWYVDAAATGNNDGSSWHDAFADLQDALAVAATGDEIWVAAGLYKPTADETDREAAFHLLNGVALYGGFAGDESERHERDWEINTTVLSGDIDNNDLTDSHGVVTDTVNIVGANSYHLVVGSGTDETAVLDGFAITAGLGNGEHVSPCGPACGGGMYTIAGSPSLTNITFSGNRATWGGAMFNTNLSNPDLNHVTFVSNSADQDGGGMYNWQNSSPILNNVVFSNNSAHWGGGMNSNDDSPKLVNVIFVGNSAAVGGGGISASNSHADLTGVSFIGNSANTTGGGFYNISGNPTLSNVSFSGNNAGRQGGGMVNRSGSPNLTGVAFSGNSAGNEGGGMFNLNSSNPSLIAVIFEGNSAGQNGGGMQNTSSSNPTLTNVIFSGNSAGYHGGGMINGNDSNPTITNVTFSGNRAGLPGGGLSNHTSNPVVQNSIFWNNSSFGSVGAADANLHNDNATPTISYSLIEGSNGSGPGWNNELGIDLGNNLDADPLFIEPPDPADAPTLAGNLRLQIGSPAIDAGNNAYIAGVATDLDGRPRLFGPQVDLGPYEARYGTLEVNVVGQGSVEIAPDQAQYLYGDVITLTAVAGPGWRFAGWSGDATGEDNPLTLTFDGDASVTAVFEQVQFNLYLPLLLR